MPAHDLVIRGGRILDGTGAPAFGGDVAFRDGRISAIGRVDGNPRRIVDADGALVMPGFVDIHTHYDGQVTWDPRVLPSSWHGVTTAVMGNCGVGFAPVRPEDHERLIELMEGVEDIPGTALHEGIRWDWETFPEYLDAVERRPHDIDIAAQVPHAALRLYVMGERGARREPATEAEIAEMGQLVGEAVEAGALGFTTSRTLNHRTVRGDPTPTLTAAQAELVGIAAAMGRTGSGVFEGISDFADIDSEFAIFRRMVEVSGRPMSISVLENPNNVDWRALLDRISAAAGEGLPIRGQVAVRGVGSLWGIEANRHPFISLPAYQEIANRDHDERVAALRDPAVKVRILEQARDPQRHLVWDFNRLFELGDPPDYEPAPSTSVGARAAGEGRPGDDLLYDLLLANDGHNLLYHAAVNYSSGDLEPVREMLVHDATLVGLGDGGAHVGVICDASFPTTLLTLWGRDRVRGERLELAWLVRRQTSDNARGVGLLDRGVLAVGMKADVNIVDFDRLRLRPPRIAFDLPAGGKRLLQRAEGYLHTFVGGDEVYTDGEPTGALPGRLVRGPRPAPPAP